MVVVIPWPGGSDFVVFFLESRLQPESHFVLSGELWSILVVRLAHSADLRSRLRHVS